MNVVWQHNNILNLSMNFLIKCFHFIINPQYESILNYPTLIVIDCACVPRRACPKTYTSGARAQCICVERKSRFGIRAPKLLGKALVPHVHVNRCACVCASFMLKYSISRFYADLILFIFFLLIFHSRIHMFIFFFTLLYMPNPMPVLRLAIYWYASLYMQTPQCAPSPTYSSWI